MYTGNDPALQQLDQAFQDAWKDLKDEGRREGMIGDLLDIAARHGRFTEGQLQAYRAQLQELSLLRLPPPLTLLEQVLALPAGEPRARAVRQILDDAVSDSDDDTDTNGMNGDPR